MSQWGRIFLTHFQVGQRTVPCLSNTTDKEDGWRGFRIVGKLDFSLIGILARISGILAEAGIGIFAVSTCNTDYIFTKEENFERALDALARQGTVLCPT